MKHFFSLFILSILFLGCRSAKVTQIPIRTVERVTERLVPIEVPGDSAMLIALFECDSLNNVLLKSISEKKGKQTGTSLDFKDGRLNFRADFKPDTIYVTGKTIEIEREVPIIVPVPEVEYRQTAFQNFLSWAGGIALLLIALWGGWKLIKRKLKPF